MSFKQASPIWFLNPDSAATWILKTCSVGLEPSLVFVTVVRDRFVDLVVKTQTICLGIKAEITIKWIYIITWEHILKLTCRTVFIDC